MGDGLNIAARLEGIAKPGAICLSEDAYRQVKQRLDLKVTDLGATQLKNIVQPVRVYSLEVGQPAEAKPPFSAVATVKPGSATPTRSRWSSRWLALAALAALVLVASRRLDHAWRPPGETGAGRASLHRRAALRQSAVRRSITGRYFADGITAGI